MFSTCYTNSLIYFYQLALKMIGPNIKTQVQVSRG